MIAHTRHLLGSAIVDSLVLIRAAIYTPISRTFLASKVARLLA